MKSRPIITLGYVVALWVHELPQRLFWFTSTQLPAIIVSAMMNKRCCMVGCSAV